MVDQNNGLVAFGSCNCRSKFDPDSIDFAGTFAGDSYAETPAVGTLACSVDTVNSCSDESVEGDTGAGDSSGDCDSGYELAVD